jgi:hypothetical protein
MTKIQKNQTGKSWVLVIAPNKGAILSRQCVKVQKREKLKPLHFLGLAGSVINYCDLEFICYLVLGVWNLNPSDWTPAFVLYLSPAATAIRLIEDET